MSTKNSVIYNIVKLVVAVSVKFRLEVIASIVMKNQMRTDKNITPECYSIIVI